MLQIGRYTAPQDERPAVIQREFYGQGYIFKDETAFLSHPDQVCYVPELSDTAYTRNDLLALCDGQEKLAQRCFDCLNWQSPTTWVDEQWPEQPGRTLCCFYDRSPRVMLQPMIVS